MPEKRTIHHIKDGPAEMDAIDANRALRQHGAEWSDSPWPKAAAKSDGDSKTDPKTDPGKTDPAKAAAKS